MTSFQYWQALAAQSGRFMCMICFDVFPLSEAHEDPIGQKWDMCGKCSIAEQKALEELEKAGLIRGGEPRRLGDSALVGEAPTAEAEESDSPGVQPDAHPDNPTD